MSNTKKAEQIIKKIYFKSECLDAHQTQNFDNIIQTLVKSKEFENELICSLRIIARDAVQNIVLENFEVVNNQIVEKKSEVQNA